MKNKTKVIIGIVVVGLLAGSFYYGSNSPGASGWNPIKEEDKKQEQEIKDPGKNEDELDKPEDQPDKADEKQTEDEKSSIPAGDTDKESKEKTPAGDTDKESKEKTSAGDTDKETKDSAKSEGSNKDKKDEGSAKQETTPKQEIDPNTGKDQYQTDPVPEGKPVPVEPDKTDVDKTKEYTCYFYISCASILDNREFLNPDKEECVPDDGVILQRTEVTFYEGENVADVLVRVCKDNGIHMEASWTPMYNSSYIEGINNLYEFDCGEMSGWMYSVNGWFPNYGASRYVLSDGDEVEWLYTCDLGYDVGGGYMAGE